MDGKGNAGKFGFNGGRNLRNYKIPEFTAFWGTVCTVEQEVSRFYRCISNCLLYIVSSGPGVLIGAGRSRFYVKEVCRVVV